MDSGHQLISQFLLWKFLWQGCSNTSLELLWLIAFKCKKYHLIGKLFQHSFMNTSAWNCENSNYGVKSHFKYLANFVSNHTHSLFLTHLSHNLLSEMRIFLPCKNRKNKMKDKNNFTNCEKEEGEWWWWMICKWQLAIIFRTDASQAHDTHV